MEEKNTGPVGKGAFFERAPIDPRCLGIFESFIF